MNSIPYISDRSHVIAAQELITLFGPMAQIEAVARANHSRTLGNVIHFCKWREVSRLIDIFTEEPEDVTRH